MEKKIEQCQILLDTVRQQYASVVWTHKIQEKQADLYAEKYRKLETVNIFVASLTACGIVSTIFKDGIVLKIITAVLSFVTVFIAAYNMSFDLKTLAVGNKTAANQLIGIRNELLQVISELHIMEKNLADINDEFVKIMQRLNNLYVEAPTTTKEAVDAAREALKVNKDYTFDDAEIDLFLPPALQGKIKGDMQLNDADCG